MKNLLLAIGFLIGLPLALQSQSTANSNVQLLEKIVVIPSLNDFEHRLWVYLPPNYHQSTDSYPVIYMHDGQNLFDDSTSFVGEWAVDETMNKVYENTTKGFIVVGIENGGEHRIDEYTPWQHEKYGGGKGAAYVNALISDLKPYIDREYRTKPKAKHTAIIGSSLGGLISYYAGLKHPSVFGKVGALSPSFWYSDAVTEFTIEHASLRELRMYILVGDQEGETMVDDTKKMRDLLTESGFNTANLQLNIVVGGVHNEKLWKSEFEQVIYWLFELEDK